MRCWEREGKRGSDREGGGRRIGDGDRDRQRSESNRNNREGEEEGNRQETLFHGPCSLALPGVHHIRTPGENSLVQNPRLFAGALAHFLRHLHLISSCGHHPHPAGVLLQHTLLSHTRCLPCAWPQPGPPFLLIQGRSPFSVPIPAPVPTGSTQFKLLQASLQLP